MGYALTTHWGKGWGQGEHVSAAASAAAPTAAGSASADFAATPDEQQHAGASGLQVIGFDMGGTSTDVSRYAGVYEHVFETTTAGVTIQVLGGGGRGRRTFCLTLALCRPVHAAPCTSMVACPRPAVGLPGSSPPHPASPGSPPQAPQLDINTVAAGGGSRLFYRNGLFVVGPESAGAHPGRQPASGRQRPPPH